jgi:hypothetical protein
MLDDTETKQLLLQRHIELITDDGWRRKQCRHGYQPGRRKTGSNSKEWKKDKRWLEKKAFRKPKDVIDFKILINNDDDDSNDTGWTLCDAAGAVSVGGASGSPRHSKAAAQRHVQTRSYWRNYVVISIGIVCAADMSCLTDQRQDAAPMQSVTKQTQVPHHQYITTAHFKQSAVCLFMRFVLSFV